jgi:hypothetical protein
MKILGGGYTFLVFYYIFINKFWKNFRERVHFYPLSPPPLCASMFVTGPSVALVTNNRKYELTFLFYFAQQGSSSIVRPQQVMVGGSFNNWQLVKMKASRTSYVIIIELPVGEHQVKNETKTDLDASYCI